MLNQTQKAEIPTISLELKCTTCTHMPVCSPFRGITQMLMGYMTDKQIPPFDSDDLAKICVYYFPMSVVDQLRKEDEDQNFL